MEKLLGAAPLSAKITAEPGSGGAVGDCLIVWGMLLRRKEVAQVEVMVLNLALFNLQPVCCSAVCHGLCEVSAQTHQSKSWEVIAEEQMTFLYHVN